MTQTQTRFAYAQVISGRGFGIGRADEGIPGYTPCPEYGVFATLDEAAHKAEELNTRRGISEDAAFQIVASTMVLRQSEAGVHEKATAVRIIEMDNETHGSDRRSIGECWSVSTLVGLAMVFDTAADENTENRGHNGRGAGAYVEAVFNDEDPDDENTAGERVEDISDPVFDGLPLGSLTMLRKFITAQKASTVWNGHNHVQAHCHHSERVMNRVRGR